MKQVAEFAKVINVSFIPYFLRVYFMKLSEYTYLFTNNKENVDSLLHHLAGK